MLTMARETLIDFFNDFAPLTSEFLIYDDGLCSRAYTYHEMASKARAFVARLRHAGVHQDDKIILYGENRPEWLIALWGALLEGVIVVPIDYRASVAFVERIDAIVDARYIITGDEVDAPRADRVWPLSSLNHEPAAGAVQGDLQKDQIAEIIFT